MRSQSDQAQTNQRTTESQRLPDVPTTWPGAFGLYKYSQQAVKRNASTLLTLILSVIALSIINALLNHLIHSTLVNLLVTLIIDILTFIITIALYFAYISSTRGKEVPVSDALHKATPLLVIKYIAMSIVSSVILLLSLVLFVIPFFFVVPRLNLAAYFLIDKNLGPLEAISASWRATKGHALKVWAVGLATVAMVLLCITIIGIPFSLYFLFMYGAAQAILYDFINQNPHQVNQ